MGDSDNLNIFIGYDSREPVASYVAAYSLKKRTQAKVNQTFLEHRNLREKKLFYRPWLIHGETGEHTDLIDGKTFSTEFSHTRFLVPKLMGYKGWALFMDADMVFLSDVKKLFEMRDDRYAVMCVKHHYPRNESYTKMDNRQQRIYTRKNWSSFVLWNCGHWANRTLTSEKVNFMSGFDLHTFSWVPDDSIGALPFTYNYISGISPKLASNESGLNAGKPAVIHYSDGGPWFPNCQEVPYAQLWIDEYEQWQRDGAEKTYSEVPTVKYEL